MNPATSADGSKGMPIAKQHAAVLAAVATYTDRYKALAELRAKEGRVLSGENRTRIEEAIAALAAASKSLGDLLAATEPKQQPDLYQLWLNYQRTLARINGVPQ
jgi:hypothetical protein